MYEFSNDVYVEIAQRLLEAIGSSDYFNGVVAYDDEDVCCRLRTTIVVRTRRIPTLLPTIITEREIVPVWWDMTTEMGSEEITNDFSFGEMMDALRLT
jgi:hypothetical protein